MEHHENDQRPLPGAEHETENSPGQGNIDASVAPAVLSVMNRLGLGKAMRAHGADEEQLLAELNHADPSVRMAVVRTLGTWGERVPVAPLLAALHDADWSVRTAAILVLGKLKKNIPVEALKAILRDEDEAVRAAAVWALGELGEQAPLEPLMAALSDSAWSVREAATLALEHLQEEVPVAPLSTTQLVEEIPVPEAEDLLIDKETKPARQNGVYTPIRPFKRRIPARHSRFTRIVERGLVALVIGGMIIAWLIIASTTHISSTGHNPPAAPSVIIYRGQRSAVGIVAWSTDGTRIASASADGTMQVWNASNGHTTYTFKGRSEDILAMAWPTPSYLLAATAASDGSVRFWDVLTSRNFMTTHCLSGMAYSGAWSPDQTRLAFSCGATGVQVWDIATGSNVSFHKSPGGRVTAIAWSPNGKQIASASYDNTIQVWDVTTGNTICTFRGHIDTAGQVNAIAWSPNGKQIASGSANVQVWNAATGNTLFTYHGHLYGVNALAWSPDGNLIASGGDEGIVQVWKVATGHTVFTYHGHTNAVRTVTWSPDGKRVASAGDDNTVQVWKVQ